MQNRLIFHLIKKFIEKAIAIIDSTNTKKEKYMIHEQPYSKKV